MMDGSWAINCQYPFTDYGTDLIQINRVEGLRKVRRKEIFIFDKYNTHIHRDGHHKYNPHIHTCRII